jgi:hypothetical protein
MKTTWKQKYGIFKKYRKEKFINLGVQEAIDICGTMTEVARLLGCSRQWIFRLRSQDDMREETIDKFMAAFPEIDRELFYKARLVDDKENEVRK